MHDSKIKPKEVYDGDSETAVNHFYEKLFKLTPDSFYTKTARQIAEHRYNYMKDFVTEFEKEWEGER